MKKKLLFLFTLLSFIGFSQEKPTITTEIDTTQIRIGEQFQYKIAVNRISEVVFPELDSLGKLEVVHSSKIDTLANTLEKNYVLTSFDHGNFFVPQQQVLVNNNLYITDSIEIKVATVEVDTVKQKLFPIKGIKAEPKVFDDYVPYFIWVWIALAIIIALLILYYVLQKYYGVDDREAYNYIPPYQEAIEKFTTLDEKELWQNNQVKEYYIELTEIIRTYIGREIELHTLEATTDELIHMIKSENSQKSIGVSNEAIEKLEIFLRNADFVKFAKMRPLEGDIRNDRRVAGDIVETLQPIITGYKEQNLLNEDEVSTYLKEEEALTKDQKNKRTLTYTGLFILIITILTTCTYQAVKPLKNNLQNYGAMSSTTKEVVANNWQEQSFGTPAMTLFAPFKFQTQTETVPQGAEGIFSSFGVYLHSNSETRVQAAITVFESSSGAPLQLEQVVRGSIQQVQNLPNISDFEYERQSITLENDVEGTLITGLLKENNKPKKLFKIIGFVHEQNSWQVMLMYPEGTPEISANMDTVIGSIKIEI